MYGGIAMRKKKPLLFYKYLLSYFIIFLIPFTMISIIFYQTSVQNLKEEIIKSNTEKMGQVKEFSDTRMKELESIANRISLDHRLTPYMFSEPYQSKQAIKELTSYKVNSAIIDELYLYYYGDDQIYSPRGSSAVETFISTVYPFKGDEANKFRESLESTSKPVVKPVEFLSNSTKRRHIISYLYPIPTNSAVAHGTVAFIVKERTITKLIESVLGDSEGNIYVYNEENELLASSNKGTKLNDKTVNKLALSDAGIIDKKINKENYSLVTVHSDVSNWTFVTAIPTDQFYGKMTNLKTSIITTLLIIALIGALATIYMSFRQYRPIQSIVQTLRTKRNEGVTKSKKKGELESIRETIEHMHRDSEQLQKKIEIHEPFIRDQLLSQLLKGEGNNLADVKEMLQDINIMFNGSYYFTIVVSFKDKTIRGKSIQGREKLVSLLMDVSFQGCVGYGVELIHDNAVAIIVNLQDIESHAITQQSFMNELKQQLADYNKQMPAIGIGKVYDGIDWVNRSFIEANAALEYNILNNNDRAMYFENMVYNEEPLWYPMEDHAKFVQSLKQGDQIVAKETLKTIINNLREQDTSIDMLRAMCFDLINTILKITMDLGLKYHKEIVKNLVQFKSLEDLEDTINIMIYYVCEDVETRKVSHNNSLRDHILYYIDKQFGSHELSLENTAEKFQISVSYLSRFMKEQTGNTFTKFVWQLRNEEFKRQLKETSKPVKEIVLEIGYVDVANFTRKFKKEEGMPPGQYRKLYQNEAKTT